MNGTIARSAQMAVAVVFASLGVLAFARPAAAAPAPEPAAAARDVPRLPGEPVCGPSLADPNEPQSGRNDNNSASPDYFAPDFPVFADSDPNTALGVVGGFGGIRRGAPLHHTPVIFVHGNQADAQNWLDVMLQFAGKAGYTMQEMYALSYNGLGNYYAGAPTQMNVSALDTAYIQQNQNGLANGGHGGADDDNVPDLCRFVEAVQWYTGSRQVDIVTHSLGDTVARRLMEIYPSLARDVVAFVGIAGGNHGTSVCTGLASSYYGCDEIAPGTAWLDYLNTHPAETYGPTQWMTVYDGAEGDPFFGPTLEQSPALAGADNRQFNSGVHGDYHNDLRVDTPEVDTYLAFLLRHGQAGPYAAAGVDALAAQLDAAAQWSATYSAGSAPLCIPLLTGNQDGCNLPLATASDTTTGTHPGGGSPVAPSAASSSLPDTAAVDGAPAWASIAAVLVLSGCRCRRGPARRRTARRAR